MGYDPEVIQGVNKAMQSKSASRAARRAATCRPQAPGHTGGARTQHGVLIMPGYDDTHVVFLHVLLTVRFLVPGSGGNMRLLTHPRHYSSFHAAYQVEIKAAISVILAHPHRGAQMYDLEHVAGYIDCLNYNNKTGDRPGQRQTSSAC